MAAPFVFDCDTGIDDALALFFLLSDPEVDLVAVTTTFGNVGAQQAATNTLALLELAGRPDIPVSVGAEHPLAGAFSGGAPHVHGDNGIGDVELPAPAGAPTDEHAAETIVRMARSHPGRLHLLATAPLTNIAAALRLEPELPRLIKEFTLMGGAALAPGNITAAGEANIFNDPEAAAEIFASDWVFTMVPLDVTMTQLLEESDRQALLAADNPVATTMGRMLARYFAFYQDVFGRPCSALHDPLAAAIATGRAIPTRAPVVQVEVDDTRGPGRGQTIVDLRGHYRGPGDQAAGRCRVVLGLVDDFAPLLMSRLLGYRPPG